MMTLDRGSCACNKKDDAARAKAEIDIPIARVLNALLVIKRTTALYCPSLMKAANVIAVVITALHIRVCVICGSSMPWRNASAV